MSETLRQSMTYGEMPTFEDFEGAFNEECEDRAYNIRLNNSDARAVDGYRLGDGDWSAEDLYCACQEVVNGAPDVITVSEDSEYENVYQVFYPGTDKPYVEIGPNAEELITWANRFSESEDITNETRAVEALNYAAAYGSVGHDYTAHDARMDLVSSIMGTLGFEWI